MEQGQGIANRMERWDATNGARTGHRYERSDGTLRTEQGQGIATNGARFATRSKDATNGAKGMGGFFRPLKDHLESQFVLQHTSNGAPVVPLLGLGHVPYVRWKKEQRIPQLIPPLPASVR